MLNNSLTRSEDESLAGLMHALAGHLIDDLQEVQECGELAELLEHADPEIRQAAFLIANELGQLIVQLSRV